jgi:WD40 repeat protein
MVQRIAIFFRTDEMRPARFVFVYTVLIILVGMVSAVFVEWKLLPTTSSPVERPVIFSYYSRGAGISALAWSPDGTRLASCDSSVRIWDAMTGGHAVMLATPVQASSDTLAWSPDGKYLAVGGSSLNTWDAITGQKWHDYTSDLQQHRQGGQLAITSLTWSPDNSMLAAALSYSRDTAHNTKDIAYAVEVWKAANGQHLFTYRGQKDRISMVLWSPDSKRIASSSDDQTLQVWDALTGKNVVRDEIPGNPAYTGIDWSPDGKTLAAINAQTIDLWQANSSTLIRTMRNQMADSSIRWSPDGRYLASGYHDVHIWDAFTGRLLFTHQQEQVQALAWSPNGKFVASGNAVVMDNKGQNSGTVQVWAAF